MSTYYSKELKREVPSVTTILNIISKGEGFNNWLKKNGDKADTLLTEAGDFGSSIHNHLEAIGKGISINLDALKDREKRCVKAFLSWKDDNVDKFIATEQEVFNTQEGYAGTLDAVVRSKTGKVWLIDYKTSSAIYDTYLCQTQAYRVAWEMANRDITIDESYILRFEKNSDKKTDMQIKKVENPQLHYEVFLAAKKIYDWRNQG